MSFLHLICSKLSYLLAGGYAVVTLLSPVMGAKPDAKPAAPEVPLLAVKPILDHGPTPLPMALKYAQLDVSKVAKQSAAQFKIVKALSQKFQILNTKIADIQKTIQVTKQQIKTDSSLLKKARAELKRLSEMKAKAKSPTRKGSEPLKAVKPLPDLEQLSIQISNSEKQVKALAQSLKDAQKKLEELKKQVAVEKKQLGFLKTKESQLTEIASLFREKSPVADPKLLREVASYQHTRPLYSCKIDPNGNYLLAGAQDSVFNRWDLVSASNTKLLGHNSWVRRFDLHGSTSLMVTGAYEGKIAWWDINSHQPKPKHLIEAHKGYVRGVSVSPDGKLVATAGNDRLVKIWSIQKAELIQTLQGHEHQIYNVKFHPGGRYLLSGDLRGNLKQWDTKTWKTVRDFDGSAIYKYDTTFRGHIGGVRGMDISQDGKYFAISGIGQVSNAFAGIGVPTVVLFDWETGKQLAIMTPSDNFKGTCWGVRFHPQSDFIAAVGGNSSGMIWFWKLGEQKPFFSQKVKSVPYDLDFHPDGLRMCIAGYDKTARLFSMAPKAPFELAKQKSKTKKKK
ncbi:WD40 repeat domain-containing protein [Gimesia aquarii]|uniref:WD domain, G-beta repeat n=1 Tax=Gimesia aquarii TaxID=2527964 RepID=A0A517W0M0_9PLAN|nr:WD40 repeat domain-containing protein [Gimesia aquarii]QDT98805.1 WD domain, G-beta repeat [Gimesia aquarii]